MSHGPFKTNDYHQAHWEVDQVFTHRKQQDKTVIGKAKYLVAVISQAMIPVSLQLTIFRGSVFAYDPLWERGGPLKLHCLVSFNVEK